MSFNDYNITNQKIKIAKSSRQINRSNNNTTVGNVTVNNNLSSKSSSVSSNSANNSIESSSNSSSSSSSSTSSNSSHSNSSLTNDRTKPNESIRKRVMFLINNMSDINIETTTKEIIKLIDINYETWLGKILVMRCKNESNLIDIYSMFILEFSNVSNTFNGVIVELLKNEIDLILRGNTIDINLMKQLKNLGDFLGRLTIAKDIHVCIDLKGLLKDSYQDYKESVEYLLPFVCRILRSIKESKLIGRFHPWCQEILSVIKELYDLTDKMSVQFEIELLFNHLDCPMNDIRAAFYLRHNPKHMHPCNAPVSEYVKQI